MTAALLAACGDGKQDERLGGDAQPVALTHDEYQKAIWDIRGGEESSRATRLFFDVVGDLGKQDCSAKSHALRDNLATVLRRVEDVRAPAEAQDAQREFLEAATESVRQVGLAADEVDNGTLTCGRAMNERIYGLPSTKQAEKAIDALVALGYSVLGD